MHLAIWIVTALLIGLWSLLAWGAYALLSLATGMPGMPADWYALLAQLPGAAWLDLWLPGWREATVAAAQWAGALFGWLGGALPVVAWVLWGLGTGVVLLCAALLSGVVAIGRRAASARPQAA